MFIPFDAVIYGMLFRSNPENIIFMTNILISRTLTMISTVIQPFNYKTELWPYVLEKLKMVCFVWICSRSPIDEIER